VRRFQGGTDVALSDRGRAQARALGRALRAYRPAVAYVSPLTRARATAELALADRPVEIRPLEELREMSLGEWEGRLSEEIRARDGDPYGAWIRAPLDCPPPGSEPLPSVRRRVLGALERVRTVHHPDEDVLVIAHGGVISVFACHVLGCSLNALWRLRVDNASLTVVKPPRIVSLNDTRHLVDDLAPPHAIGPADARRVASSSGGFAAATDVTTPPSEEL
jgi:broad specificity phosphatase PhoE